MDAELKALGEVNFSTFYKGSDIWRDDGIHVDGIHTWAFDRVLDSLDRVREGASVGNLVIQGRPGIGKSHFLGRVRHAVIERGQVFVLFQPGDARDFWAGLAVACADALHRESGGGGTQLRAILRGLGGEIGLRETEIEALASGALGVSHLKDVRRSLQLRLGRRPADRVAVDVALALILTNSEDPAHQDVGEALTQGLAIDDDEARAHAIRKTRISCREVVAAFDRLVGASGRSTLVAIDQLDGLVAHGRSLSGPEQQSLLDRIATGLMDLAEDVQHSLVVVSCLIDSWTLIRERAVASAHDRYPAALYLRPIPSPRVGAALIAAYLRAAYARAGFTPPYPTWPVRPAAFADADQFSPRSLINRVQDHCARCVERSKVAELEQLIIEEPPRGQQLPVEEPPRRSSSPPSDLDQRFSRLVQEANVADALDEKRVDQGLPALLRAGLMAWAEENAAAGDFSVDPLPGPRPPLHGRLRRIVDADTDDEVHWSFRAVLNASPVASLNRLRAAVTASGLGLSGERRRLVVLRNTAWSRGRKTQQALDEFLAHGGAVVELAEADLKAFRALQQLLEEQPTGLATWLRERRHASGTALLAPLSSEPTVSAAPAEAGETSETAEPTRAGEPARSATSPTTTERPRTVAPSEVAATSAAARGAGPVAKDSIVIGIAEGTGRQVTVPLEDLRRHTVIFAGSGSGKTVLIRRLVEECALKGVSAIVLDPNNDLARLGLPWPEPPEPGSRATPRRLRDICATSRWWCGRRG